VVSTKHILIKVRLVI